MIRIILLGRTGNNMFQYAFGRALANKHGVPLVLDASWFNSQGWSEVSHFLRLPIKAKVTRRFSLPSRALRNYGKRHFWELMGIPILKESPTDQSFDPYIANAPSNCMLWGYFQTPLYFESIASELRLELKMLLSSHVKLEAGNLKESLSSTESVAVHVRRGDYLQNPTFAVCDSAYYRRAMERMRGMLGSPQFYIFSDDPDWCRAEFRDTDTKIVDTGRAALDPLHDLLLMSLASHHIISNSSYSWWAAWLADTKTQQVIMPDRWFTREIVAPAAEKRWK